MLTLEQAKKLIDLARNSIETYFSRREQKITKEIKAEFSTVKGLFVTLSKNKKSVLYFTYSVNLEAK